MSGTVKRKRIVIPFIFSASTDLEASAGEVFAFHENPNNISRIAPRGLRVVRVGASPTARQGEIFTIVVRQFGVPLHWVGRWENVVPGRLLVDVGVKCPFPFWRHEHRFEEIGRDRCRMTDRVSVAAPWPGFSLFAGIFLRRMFRERHALTTEFFR